MLKKFLLSAGILLIVTNCLSAEELQVSNTEELKKTLLSAKKGDQIYLRAGTYFGPFKIIDGLTLNGEDKERVILTLNTKEEPVDDVLDITGKVVLRNLTVKGGRHGINVNTKSLMDGQYLIITENLIDGIAFNEDFNTGLVLKDSIISKNGQDGIDLESTQAQIVNTKFINNYDDGLDFDGNAGGLVLGCDFIDNIDDGIEIRLLKKTQAIIQDSTFSGHGEDGLEIINSRYKKNISNYIAVQNSTFKNNKRYGVGFVRQAPKKIDEVHTGELAHAYVSGAENIFENNGEGGVSPNYSEVFERHKNYPKTITASFETKGKLVKQEVPVSIPKLIGYYSLKPTPDGKQFADAEGMAVSMNELFVADDDFKRVFVLNRRTGKMTRKFRTDLFEGSTKKADGPEGLDYVTDGKNEFVYLSDDNPSSPGLFEIAVDNSNLGKLLRWHDTQQIGMIEGVVKVNDHLFATARGLNERIFKLDHKNLSVISSIEKISFTGLGEQINGIGADLNRNIVLATLAPIHDSSQTKSDGSAYFELTPDMKEVKKIWHLGSFALEPRAIASRDGLVYILDQDDYHIKSSKELKRRNLSVLVFSNEESKLDSDKLITLLPRRDSHA